MAHSQISQQERGIEGSAWRWGLLVLVLLAIILVPFALFGSSIEAWTHGFIQEAQAYSWQVAAVLAGLLISDVLLPIPSSIVSTAGGILLGFVGGTITSFAGMTLGGVFGYWLGLTSRGPVGRRLLNAASLRQLEVLTERTGDWWLILARPVPVLAEASLFFAGLSRMPLRRFLLLVSLSNLGLAAAWSAVGAFAATINSFLLAFAGAVLLPGLGLFVVRMLGKKR